jgi:hypothetical protein
MFECDTLLPVAGRFPVTWHTFDIIGFASVAQTVKKWTRMIASLRKTYKRELIINRSIGGFILS